MIEKGTSAFIIDNLQVLEVTVGDRAFTDDIHYWVYPKGYDCDLCEEEPKIYLEESKAIHILLQLIDAKISKLESSRRLLESRLIHNLNNSNYVDPN